MCDSGRSKDTCAKALKHLLLQIVNNASLCDENYGICSTYVMRSIFALMPVHNSKRPPLVKKGLGSTLAKASKRINSPKWANVRPPKLRKDKQEDIC